jgi:hypothetical protein
MIIKATFHASVVLRSPPACLASGRLVCTPLHAPPAPAAACESGSQQAVARQYAVWTGRAGGVRRQSQGFPRARGSGRSVWGRQGGELSVKTECGGPPTPCTWG